MIEKIYLSPGRLTHDSFELAAKIWRSGFRPDVIMALWRGGSPVGIAVHEFFRYKEHKCHTAVLNVTSYTGIGESNSPVVENIDCVVSKIGKSSKILVVDDIFDTGMTAAAVKTALRPFTDELRFAVPYFRSPRKTVDFSPDYYVYEVDKWLVFPHELVGLTHEEIRKKDPRLYALITSETPNTECHPDL